jgi:hypothetical protein
MKARLGAQFLAGAVLLAMPVNVRAGEARCSQTLVDGTTPPTTSSYIYPRQAVRPFYQWESNFGYCGEVNLIQAGLSNGQWMSQFNARLICGTGLSQSGPDNACAAHDNQVDFNAQVLFESPGTGVSGPNTFAAAPLCLSNLRLNAASYDYTAQASGMAGYQQYMSWVKQQVISGHFVAVALLFNGGTDAQYDHEVPVIKIGTNHSATDSTYYPDDVLYFEDHGVYTLSGNKFTDNPAIPPGAGTDAKGCTPYLFGYTFGSLANTRAGANAKGAQGYSIVVPGNQTIKVYTGGNGYNKVGIKGPHNYAFSVAGPEDVNSEALPVALTIVGPTVTEGSTNPLDPIAGFNYENPYIGASDKGKSCTNTPPNAWMTNLVLQATVSGLTTGVSYNLYEYEFSSVNGAGPAAALAVPVANFNANAGMATHLTTFTATASTYVYSITTTSDQIVIFRCVPFSAP